MMKSHRKIIKYSRYMQEKSENITRTNKKYYILLIHSQLKKKISIKK